MSSFFSAQNIHFSYEANKPQLHGVDLEINNGEVVALVGPSGCGKTTLLRVIAGLEQVDEGQLQLDGAELNVMPANQRGIGVVFQTPTLLPHLTVFENIAFVIRNPDKAIVDELIKRVQLDGFGCAYPSMLSGGQQQRVAIARALALSPKLLLLDEPFANLDVVLRETMREEIATLIRALRIPTLLVTHDPEDALQMADRIYAIERGKVTQAGVPLELYSAPSNAFVMRFFGEINSVQGNYEDGYFHSPFGAFAAAEECGGKTDLALYVRPEDVQVEIHSKKGYHSMQVIHSTFLGVTQMLYLTDKDASIRLKVRLVGDSSLPKVGDTVFIKIGRYFIF